MAIKSSPGKKKLSPLNLDVGKVPPQAIDIEEAVLGAILMEKDAVISVLDILKPESFYKDAHQKIYNAIVELSTKEKPIDILTVTEELRSNNELENVGGPFYITQLTNRVASSAHIEYHSRIVAQKYIQRELIRISSEIQNRAFDDSIDVDDLLDFSERELFNIAEGNIKRETAKINVLIKKAIERIEEAAKHEETLVGVPSGYTKLDRLTSGWQKSDLIIIAGRPSMGKTAFALSMGRTIAVEHNRPIAFFSLEMSSVQLVNRLIVSETELPSNRIRNGNLDEHEWKQLDTKIKQLVEAPIYIDDSPAISIFELRAKCRRLKLQHDIQLIFVDYLQLMTGPPNTLSREQEVSSISRSLKSIAKELDVPIIALSQLNRSVEIRSGSKRPQLSDLRESGAIEQDADMVLFIHRPEKYGIFEDDDGNSLVGLAEILLSKNRNGPIGDIILRFREEFAKFVELDEIPVSEMSSNDDLKTYTVGSKMNSYSGQKGKEGSNKNPEASNEPPF
ncbi:MAG: replicative DNA helicase [Bacteroidales bacterium]|nr:replicative DNA helicase [Bacteroidales bacterium]